MAPTSAREFLFDSYVLDPVSASLTKGTESVPADVRLIRCLTALVEKHEKMVSREFLKRKLWRSTKEVRDGDLDVLVCQLRKLLGDDPRKPRFIKTYRSEGYQFICPVRIRTSQSTDEHARSRTTAICQKARHRWGVRTPQSIRESIQLYRKAIKEDPNYAPAWAGRADAWIMAGIHCLMPPAEAFLRARSDASDALRLTPNLPEAIVSEAWVKLCFDRDLAAARRDLMRAIRLKPEYPFAYNGLALLYIALGKPHRAAIAMEKAWGLNAASPFLNALLADALYHTRDYEKAAERGKFAVESDPGFAVGHACLGKIYLQQTKVGDAIRHLKQAARLSPNSPVMLGFLAHALGIAGRRASAEHALNHISLCHRREQAYIPAYFLAIAYVGLGDAKEALKNLEEAIDERSHWVLFLGTEPMFDSLRPQKRFQFLAGRLSH